jgi:hypothetical protein
MLIQRHLNRWFQLLAIFRDAWKQGKETMYVTSDFQMVRRKTVTAIWYDDIHDGTAENVD